MRKFLFYFLSFILVLLVGLWLVLHSEIFWRWAGHKVIHSINDGLQGEHPADNIEGSLADGFIVQQVQLIDTINKNIRGKLIVDKIEGTPFSGWVFKGIKLMTPEGEIFQAKAFMLRVSLWSVIRLKPVIDKIALYEPVLTLEKDKEGQWNLNRLYRPQEGSSSSILEYFRSLDFSHIMIDHGQVEVQQPGGIEMFRDINLNASLQVFRPATPLQRLELEKLLLSADTPWGPYDLKTHVSYDDKHQIKSFDVALQTDKEPVLSLSGNRAQADHSNIVGEIATVPPALMALLYKKWPSAWQENVKFEIHGSPEDVQFSLDSNIHTATINLKGVVNLTRGETTHDVHLKIAGVSPEMLFALGVPGGEYYCEASPLNVNVHLQGTGLDWPPPEFSWQLKTEPLIYKQAKIDQLSLKISGSQVQQTVNLALCGNFGSLSLKSQGSFFTAPNGDIKLEVVDLEPALLGLQVDPGSYISLDFDGKFGFPKPYVLNNLTISGQASASGCINGYPLDKAEGRFSWENRKLNLQSLQAKVGNVMAELKGTLAGDRLDFSTEGKTLPEGDWPVPETVQGVISWTGTIQGTISEPSYVIQAQSQELAVGSVALQSVTLRARGQGLPPRNATMDLRAGGVKTPAMTFGQMIIKVEGAGSSYNYQINASSPAAESLIRVAGTLNLQEQSYSMEGRGKNLALGAISLQAFTVRAQGQGLPPRTGSINLKATDVKTSAGTFQQLTLEADGQGGRWRYQLKGSSPPPGPLVELAGNADLGSRPMSMVIERLNLHVAKISVQNQGQIQARFIPGLDLPTATLKVNGGTVQVAARLQGDQISGRLEVRKVPLDVANVKGLSGTVQSQLTLSGSARNPVLQGDLKVDAVKLKQYAFNPVNIFTHLDYRGETLKITGKAEESSRGISLSWNGKLPVQVSLSPVKFNISNSGLDFAVKSEGANLKLLEPVIPELAEANVPIALAGQIKGNWQQPDVEAHIRWQQGTITLHEAGTPYAVSPGVLDWHANKLSLSQLTLESGGGTTVLTAHADFKGFQPQRVYARVSINNFKVLEGLGSEAWLNGEINVDGPLSALEARGRLTISKATINPALVQAQTQSGINPDIIMVRHQKAEKFQKKSAAAFPAVYKNMSIDISVDAPNNVFVKENSPEVRANVELRLDIRINKKPGEALAMAGTVRSLQGEATVFNQEFKIERALVTLPGNPKQQPFIEARASHEMDEGTMFVDVSGPANKPHIDISSDPPKPPNELMSQLIFGQPASNLSQQQFSAEQQAVGVLGGITALKIQNLLGGAIPFLGQVSFTGTQGKYILSRNLAPGVKILLEHRNSPALGGQGGRTDANVIKIQYRINRYLRLQAEQGQRNTGGDIQFKKDF